MNKPFASNASKKSVLPYFTPCIILSMALLAGDASAGGNKSMNYSGVYCLNIQNMEMTIIQTGSTVAFALDRDVLTNGTGTVTGDTMALTATIQGTETFTATIVFSKKGREFSGPYQVTNSEGQVTMEGILQGNRGECPKYDLDTYGVPRFVGADFTQLSKIEMISKFRSGFGHDFNDGTETCRSMKHYYNPYEGYRDNDTVEIYSPVKGTIISVVSDGHGASIGLKNKQIHIQPRDQPAFTFVIFHCDTISSAVAGGKKVQAGELLGHARLYYDDLDEYASSFDIAVWVNTPSGSRLVPYFESLSDGAFASYVSRGVLWREEFTITKEERDADPLECDGEQFLTPGNLDNWVTLD